MQDFTYSRVLGEKPATVDRLLGKPLSVGLGGTFREYNTKRGSWYVKFDKGVATSATVTFRAGFASPQLALRAVGISVGLAKPTKQNLLLRRWERVARLTRIEAQSTDGKTWETVAFTR